MHSIIANIGGGSLSYEMGIYEGVPPLKTRVNTGKTQGGIGCDNIVKTQWGRVSQPKLHWFTFRAYFFCYSGFNTLNTLRVVSSPLSPSYSNSPFTTLLPYYLTPIAIATIAITLTTT